MLRNIYYDTNKSIIHLWEEIDGKRMYDNIPWTPYYFQKTKDKSDIKTLEGYNVKKVTFNDYKQYMNEQKEAINVYENSVMPTLQFLSERYYGINDEDFLLSRAKLKIYSLDIEVHSEDSFPHAEQAQYPIPAINIKCFNGDSYTWGIKPYNGKTEFKIDNGDIVKLHYFYCKNEPDLLKSFILWFHKNAPDVLTGWNISADTKVNSFGGFDLPYIVNRCKVLFGKDTKIYHKLSPISRFRSWVQKNTGAMYFDIAGVSVIDYMSIYKWYTPKNQENYKLETICQDELGIGKIDYTAYGHLRNLYHDNWDLYVEYNVIDDVRVEELEHKLGYIKLAHSLSLLCKTPLKSFNASVQQIEGLLLTYYRRNNLCAPYFAGGNQEHFPAAYVKSPQKGLHKWVIDIDIASSYPTSIIIMNMSPETYIGRIMNLREEQIIECCRNKRFDLPFQFVKTDGISKIEGKKLNNFNAMFKKKMITIAPCGTVFDNTKKGVYASVEKSVFFKRKEVKKKMLETKKEAYKYKNTNKEKYDYLMDKAAQYFSFQWALKIVLNQAFGVLAVPYCRYFNTNIAEAITSASKLTIKEGQSIVNRLLNNPSKYDELFNNELNKTIKEINNA